jgi:N-acetyl-gamma-glutamyl-phosphate reductase
MIRVGIYGATGYTGYELVKLLGSHPESEIVFATSRSSAGQRMSDLYPCPYDVRFVAPEEADLSTVDVVYTCLPHGEAMGAVRDAWQAGVRAIDLSADFRLRDVDLYQQWYKVEHVAPELLDEAVYGLVEVYRDRIAGARLVASPGCYPTSALLALYPLVKGGHLGDGRIIVDSKSGVSGAGRKLSLTTHFCEVNESFKPYSIGRAHRHTSELDQELAAWGVADLNVTFAPHLLPVSRGILSTIYVTLEPGWSVQRLVELYNEVYAGEPFVHVLPAGTLASLAYVTHTNRCALSFAAAGGASAAARGNDFIIVSTIDNLVKGASGQAVQSMNVMYGLDETTGLPV